MIKFKPEVRIRSFNMKLAEILLHAGIWSTWNRIDVEVNSVDDSDHGAATLHGWSLAADLDTEADRPSDLESLYQYLRRFMPEGFDVIHEKDHVHVEWDVKRKESRL